MLTESHIAGSDDWWMLRLCHALGDGLPRMKKLTSYRDGDALLPETEWDFGTRQAYFRFMKRSRLHSVETIRNARTDRQHVIGFRTGAAGDESGDLAAWKHWARNRMKVQERTMFNDAGDYGRVNLLTIPDERGPLFLIRNEWTSIVEMNTLRPYLADAGILVGYDHVLGVEVVTLFRPGYYRVAFRRTRVPTLPQDGSTWHPSSDWEWAGEAIRTPYTQDALIHQYKTVDGFGVYEKHLDSVDRVNELTLNALTVIVMQSFRQRAVKGNLPEFYPQDHPRAGERVDYDEIFKAGPAALWMLPMDADIWESTFTDVTPVYNARKEELRALFSLTQTPLDMLGGESENQSALGAQTGREPLQHAVKGMNEQAEMSIAQQMALAFLMEGDTERGDITELEVMFDKITPETLAEKAEAAPKFKAGGASQRYIDEVVFGMTPQQRRDAEQDRQNEALEAALNAGIGNALATGNPAPQTGVPVGA
ncbi:hypothetical protein O1W71_01990 [Microbacterium sp. H37-C3]|uniref:hypothetical protein n=1 Tax=Microbacterium sp. H37-C3 TaxID=3004354 RepID=UPI0022B02742|nr:hypothetical protein [Microbacterium sp. H37-C3]MCZ4066439.1 hypothetical protein [Microbacterium sp. H37-C3]